MGFNIFLDFPTVKNGIRHVIGVNGLQKIKQNDETKVKCKEVVNEALRQYWDHSHGGEVIDSGTEDRSNENQYLAEGDDEEPTDENESNECNEQNDSTDENEDNEESEVGMERESHSNDQSLQPPDSNTAVESSSETNAAIEDNSGQQLKESEEKNEQNQQLVNSNESNEEQTIDLNESSFTTEEKDNNINDVSDANDVNDVIDDLGAQQNGRSRAHIDDILRVYEIGSQEDTSEQNLILSIYRE
ncbi:unnamed protein product, partial [Medioppia subpectinata]